MDEFKSYGFDLNTGCFEEIEFLKPEKMHKILVLVMYYKQNQHIFLKIAQTVLFLFVPLDPLDQKSMPVTR